MLAMELSDGRTSKLPTVPVTFGDTRYEVRLPPPALGEHTNAVLAELGYLPAEIDELRAAHAVLQSDRMLAIDA